MNNKTLPRARRSGLVVQQSQDDLLVYDLDANKAHCLNKTMAAVWRACNGQQSVEEIAGSIRGIAQVSEKDEVVWLAIEGLQNSGLLEDRHEIKTAGQTRRELIKRAGLASAVALPVIASLVAPSNALAAASCACVANGDCTTQLACQSQLNCNGAGICAP